jgi:hypothetical protein
MNGDNRIEIQLGKGAYQLPIPFRLALSGQHIGLIHIDSPCMPHEILEKKNRLVRIELIYFGGTYRWWMIADIFGCTWKRHGRGFIYRRTKSIGLALWPRKHFVYVNGDNEIVGTP